MGLQMGYDSEPTRLNASLKEWQDKATAVAVGQKITAIDTLDDGTVVVVLDNARALVFMRPEARAIGEEKPAGPAT